MLSTVYMLGLNNFMLRRYANNISCHVIEHDELLLLNVSIKMNLMSNVHVVRTKVIIISQYMMISELYLALYVKLFHIDIYIEQRTLCTNESIYLYK